MVTCFGLTGTCKSPCQLEYAALLGFPISGLRKDSNEILIYVNGYSFQSAGTGNIQFNNVLVNSQQYLEKIWDRRTVFQINMIFSATIGLICFIIWLFRRSETTFGWLALSSLLWILFISNVLTTENFPFHSTISAAKANMLFYCLYPLFLSVSDPLCKTEI